VRSSADSFLSGWSADPSYHKSLSGHAVWEKAIADFATSWTAIAASSRPAILVTSSTPLSVSSRWMTRAKRRTSRAEE
jgi:hypothetical protein